MNTLNYTNTRHQTIDFLKGVGIIYVVLGHTLVNPMHDFIYSFHMPLFYFVSGFCYNDDYTFKPINLINNRIKTLYIPFLKYSLTFLLLHNFFFRIYVYSDMVNYHGIILKEYTSYDYLINFLHVITFSNREQLLGTFWFFTVLFSINIGFCLLRFILFKLINNNNFYLGVIILLLYISGSVLQFYSHTLPRHIEISSVAILIFYIGFLYKKNINHIPINKLIAIFSLVILVIGVIYAKHELYNHLSIKMIKWIIFALSGIYFNIYLSQLNIFKNNQLIIFFGQNTIVIMALHFLSFKIINLLQVIHYKYPLYMIASFPVIDGSNGWWILYSIVGLFIPLSIKYIYLNFKYWFSEKIKLYEMYNS